MERFQKMINKIMEEKGWNRQELAQHYKVSKSQVTRWFAGQTPRADTYEAIKTDFERINTQKAV